MLTTRINSRLAALLGSAVGSVADDEGPATSRLVVILGQSNGANGQQSTVNLKTSQRRNIGAAYAAVPYYQKSSQARVDPPVFDVNIAGAPLSSYTSTVNNNSGHGIDGTGLGPIQALGRHLDYYAPGKWVVGAFGVSGTDASNDWAPNGPFPTGGPCLLTQGINYINAIQAATGVRLAAIIWDQGETDALDPTKSANYQTNAQAIFDTLHAAFPAAKLVFKRLPSTNTAANLAVVRTAQQNLALANAYSTMVDSDGCQLTDGTHFDADGYAGMGDRYAWAVLGALGMNTQPKPWTIDPLLLVATPANATEWAALIAAAGPVNTGGPARLYLMQDTGAPLVDVIAGTNLTLTGTTPAFQAKNGNVGRLAVDFTAINQGEFDSTAASLPDPATTSWARFVLAFLTNPTAVRNCWILGTAGFEAFSVTTTGWQMTSGGNTTVGVADPRNTVGLMGSMRDVTHATSKAYTHNDKITGTQGVVTGKKIALGQSTFNDANSAYFYMVDFDGASAEKSDADWKLIWSTANWGNPNLGAVPLTW